MFKHFLIVLLFLTLTALSQSAIATEVPPPPKVPIITKAKIRGDGMLIDDNDLIIGIRNNQDERANAYELYYYGVSPEGDVTEYSVYKVYQNPVTTNPDFLQERLIEEEKDDSEIIAKSIAAQNALIVYEDRIFFNGSELKSGSVANGGIVTLVKGDLYYNGEQIQSGTVVNNGQVVQIVK